MIFLTGKQIILKDLRQANSIYVAAKRKRVDTLRFEIADAEFPRWRSLGK
jgi:hypothetical protein